MKLILLLALGGAHASTRHKTTKNAVDAETTQRLAVEAASASVIKMPGAVAIEAHAAGTGEPPVGRAAPRSGGCPRSRSTASRTTKVLAIGIVGASRIHQQAHHQSPV